MSASTLPRIYPRGSAADAFDRLAISFGDLRIAIIEAFEDAARRRFFKAQREWQETEDKMNTMLDMPLEEIDAMSKRVLDLAQGKGEHGVVPG